MSIHKIFIDTKNFSDKSKVKIELNDEYIRKYRRTKFFHSKYYLSVKTFQMFNQFNNISKNINDTIEIYDSSFNKINEFIIREGNPSVIDIVNLFNNNDDMKTLNITLSFDTYNNTFNFENKGIDKRYLKFINSNRVFGFKSDSDYYGLETTEKLFGEKSANVQGDTLLLFNLTNDSDISLKKASYDNINKDHFILNGLFHIQPINVLPGDIIYYSRECDNIIELIFDRNSLRNFTIEVYNQDKDKIDMSDYFMELEIIEKKENKFLQMILILLQSIIQLLV